MIITFLSRQHHHLANLSLFFSSFFPYRSITTPPTLQLIPSSPFRPSSLSSIYTTSPTSHFFPVPPPLSRCSLWAPSRHCPHAPPCTAPRQCSNIANWETSQTRLEVPRQDWNTGWRATGFDPEKTAKRPCGSEYNQFVRIFPLSPHTVSTSVTFPDKSAAGKGAYELANIP